jgi:hypothetical protein
MNSYELSRSFTDWAFDNPEKIKPIHYAIYFFSIEHCNRLGWKNKFGLPSQMVMESIGVKNWRTYAIGLNDLVDWGFISMVEVSKNQYSSNIISLSATVKNTKADTKALDKALSKHSQKQHTKQSQSIVSIDKQFNNITSNKEQGTIEALPHVSFSFKKSLIDLGVEDPHLSDWLKVRKEKKASNTQTALTTFLNQVNESNLTANECVKICAGQSWSGFKKEWLTNQSNNYGKQTSESGRKLIEQLANSDLWKGA